MPSKWLVAAYQRTKLLPRYLTRDFWEAYQHRVGSVKQAALTITSLNQVLQDYMAGPHLRALLRYEDRNSMRFSVESRTPFADDLPLIELLFRIPASYKIHAGRSKYLLRQAMQGILPEPLRLRRDKIGFATPEVYWFKERQNELTAYLSGKIDEYIDLKLLLRDWEKIIQTTPPSGMTELWRVINVAVWRKVFHL